MSARATIAGVLATTLLATLMAADGARANRLDQGARALREPGVWVDRDLSWLVGPAQARRLARRIDHAGVALRIAVLPQVAVDESRGDQRAIARGLMRRVARPGLYVLVGQEGVVAYAARRLPLDVSEYSFPARHGFERSGPLIEVLDAIVPALQKAPPGPPVSFEPYANPKGLPVVRHGSGDSLVGVALGSALLGSFLGFALYCFARAAAGVATLVLKRRRRHA